MDGKDRRHFALKRNDFGHGFVLSIMCAIAASPTVLPDRPPRGRCSKRNEMAFFRASLGKSRAEPARIGYRPGRTRDFALITLSINVPPSVTFSLDETYRLAVRLVMIKSFADKRTAAIFAGYSVKGLPAQIQKRARAKLMAIDAAAQLDDLRIPPGNRLEALQGDRKGQHSIRINNQWRICFVWQDDDAWDAEIVDYH